MTPDINQILAEIRPRRVHQWKKEYRSKHHEYDAPEPTDKDLGFPLQMLTVHWETGFICVDLEALAKLPAAKRNKIYKLGGLK